jgi:1-acyl-sn-glycerol-3-phosphate acyltransferase
VQAFFVLILMVLYRLLKLYARFAIRIYCRKIVINKPEYLQARGPLLFAANHPNSFLDGVILTTLLEEDLYSLARGDAFNNKKARRILEWLHQLPVYRTSEGKENLQHNYTTFEACHEVFKKNGCVLIFSEGACVNEWQLRPLRKGTARLATTAWDKGIDLTVIPVGFNYNPFRNFGKNVFINFGEPINKEAIPNEPAEGKRLVHFNEALRTQLQTLVYEIDPADKQTIRQRLYVHQPITKKVLLALPAAIGFLLHAPLYFSVKAIVKKYSDNDHFDSIIACLQMLLYLVYLPVLCLIAGIYFGWPYALLMLVLAPFFAWACVQVKEQLSTK